MSTYKEHSGYLSVIIIFRALMLPATVDLGPEGVVYIDEIKNSIAVGTVKHAFSVDLSVR